MTRKIVVVTVCVVCCIVIISFASFVNLVKSYSNMSNYEMHVEEVRKQIPIAIQFIDENEEFLEILNAVKEKLRLFIDETNGDENTLYYEIYQIKKDIIFRMHSDVYTNDIGELRDKNKFNLFTEKEKATIRETLINKINLREKHIEIKSDNINIYFASYMTADLSIENPPREIEESNDYYEYSYGIIVNDDWGIYLQRYGEAN